MQNPDSVEINLVERTKVPEQIGDAKPKISEVTANLKCPFRGCEKVQCHVPWHKPCAYNGLGTVKKIWPMVLITGIMEVCFSCILVVFLILYRFDYDRIYGTEQSRLMSKSTFGGLLGLAASGILLLVSLMLDQRRIMWFRILTSIALGVYIFVLSILKIHFALLTVEKDPHILKQQNQFLLSTACIIGLLTLLASVVHFTGNVAVFTYYNMRFIHPIMFDCSPRLSVTTRHKVPYP